MIQKNFNMHSKTDKDKLSLQLNKLTNKKLRVTKLDRKKSHKN